MTTFKPFTPITDRNCMSFWLPLLNVNDLPRPRTEMYDIGDDWRDLIRVLDGESVPLFDQLVGWLREGAAKLGGYPVFLRTGHGSGKHQWKDTCFVPDADAVPAHVAALVEWSECVDMLGLSYRIWAVRELLPVDPVAVLPAYGDMPLVREVRAFVADGKVRCVHPYWPAGSVRQGFRTPPENLDEIIGTACSLPKYLAGWAQLADRAAAALAFAGGAWSLDLLETRDGWKITDMAEAGRSYHWDGCQHAKDFA